MSAQVDRAVTILKRELRGPAVYRIFKQLFTAESIHDETETMVAVPENYYMAAGESLAFVLGISWVITLIFQPKSPLCMSTCVTVNGVETCNYVNEAGVTVTSSSLCPTVIQENALKHRIGYNNLCVGFDTQPAQPIAAALWIGVSYLACRFAVLDIQRTKLVRHRLSYFKIFFSIATDVLYMLSFAGFMFVFIIHPWDNVWGHTTGFIFLAVVQWFVLLANTLEGEDVDCLQWMFVVAYGIITIVDFSIIGGNYLYYGATGKGPWNPWWIGAVFDYGWFACLPLTTVFLPISEGLKRDVMVIHPSKLGNLDEDSILEDVQGCWGTGTSDEDDDSQVS